MVCVKPRSGSDMTDAMAKEALSEVCDTGRRVALQLRGRQVTRRYWFTALARQFAIRVRAATLGLKCHLTGCPMAVARYLRSPKMHTMRVCWVDPRPNLSEVINYNKGI
jgi:hypothetical protein